MAYTTIDNPGEYFNTVLYTGNKTDGGGGSDNITGVGFSPNWVWIKGRSAAKSHYFYDTVRGATKQLNTNNNNDENTGTTSLTAFLSDGFTLGDEPENNDDGVTFVSWNWKESATAGFDICSWTGNGSAQNISHNLSKVPTMIIVKNRTDDGADWYCYNVHNGNTHSILLNTSGAKVGAYSDNWNNTTPTSSVFTVGSSNSTGGSSGDNMIAYVFTDIKGYSKFGSYTGNGNADGTFVYTGFKPAWVMFKKSSATGNWFMMNNKMFPANGINASGGDQKYLFANTSNNEQGGYGQTDILSNGFKLRGSDGDLNGSGVTYIYMTFAENPFVTSTGVPATAR